MTRASVVAMMTMIGCAGSGGAGDGGDGGFEREMKGGRMHALAIDRIDVASVIDDHDELAPGVRSAELETMSTRETRDAGGGRLVHVSTRQRIDGLPVHGTYVNLTFREGDAGAALVGSAYHVFEGPRVDTSVAIGEDAAVAAAREAMRVEDDRPVTGAALEVWALDDGLALVWVVDLEAVDERALVRAGGARAGEVTARDERVYDGGIVHGTVAVGGAPGGAGHAQTLPLADLEIKAGNATAYTDAAGRFQIANPNDAVVKARLRGRAADVRDASAAGLTAAAEAGARIELTLGGTSEAALAQVTAYHAITATRTFLLAAGLPAEDLGEPVTATVDVSGSCNAYYDPAARAFSFFRSGGGCENSAEASIIAHEYGHFVDDAYGGILDDGLSEGWGDALACLSRGTPLVGPDLIPGELLRTCDNDYVFPVSGEDEVHALGQAWSGFVWHARQALMTQLGASHGDALVRALVLPSLVSNAADIPSAVREVFLRDDDDGTLTNRTPHWNALWAAAEQHGLTFALDGDAIAPERVRDLGVVGIDETSAKLRWTTPGDDGANGGAAAYYDLRTSTVPLTEATFAQATRVPAPDPIAPGAAQGATIPLVPGGAVYVGLRTIDDAGNQSALSNVVRVEPAPADVIYSDGAESGLGGWHVTGLWHITSRRAAAAGHAFWYGDEARGNFHTGARTNGTLTSPAIDLAGVERPALALAEMLDVELATKFDVPTITVRDVDDASIAVTLRKDGGSTGGAFRTRVLDLSVLAGRRVRIELAFDSVDGKANKGEGWFVDDIRVVGMRGATPVARGLVINEVLADPPSGWDSGGDGMASTLDDECLELVNAGDAPLDVSGWTIADAVRTRVTIPDGTVIAAGDCLLVVGGGAAPLPGVASVIAAAGLSLNNGGDTVRIRRPAGELAVELGWGGEGGHDSALVRQMDGDAESPMVRHADLVPAPASPGRRIDGSPWMTTEASSLVINEILADPPAGYDASGDGIASTTSDEFVELVNGGATAIDLGGATISDGLLVRATLPPGTTLAPGRALAVFGGSAGLALNNTGDTVTIASSAGALLATVSYGTEGGHDQSLVRTHDGQSSSPLIGHLSLSTAPASPGRRTSGAPF